VTLLTSALHQGPPGPYQLQAAIAAIHDEAPSAADTDWPQIVALYERLLQVSSNPVAALNHAVAVAMASGPHAGLDLLNGLAADQRIVTGHRFHAVRAHLLEMAGDCAAARGSYLEAAGRAGSLPHQRYLNAQAARLSENSRQRGDRLQVVGGVHGFPVEGPGAVLPVEVQVAIDVFEGDVLAAVVHGDGRVAHSDWCSG